MRKLTIITALFIMLPLVSQAKTLDELMAEKGIVAQDEIRADMHGSKVYWNKGTRLEFPDTGFSTRIFTELRTRYEFTDYDDGIDNDSSFDVNNVRLGVAGHILNSEFGYYIKAALTGDKNTWTGRTDATSADILDAYITWSPCDEGELKMGQFKSAVSRAYNTSLVNMQFADRSIASDFFDLGRQAGLAGVVGADFYGEKIRYRLKEQGVDDSLVITDSDRPTTTKKRVIVRGQQVVRIDSEKRNDINKGIEDRLKNDISNSIQEYDAVVVSDYAKGVMTPGMLSFFAKEIESKGLGFNSCPVILDPKPSNKMYYQGFNIIKPNKREAELIADMKISDRISALEAAKKIKEMLHVDAVLLSLGADGLLLYSDDYPNGFFSDTYARKVFDVSGAGDALVASFVAAIVSGASPDMAVSLANLSAAYVVSEVGTIPVDRHGLELEIKHHYE